MRDNADGQVLKPQPRPAAGPGAMSGERPGGMLAASLARSAIALRPATPADTEFCYRLHKAAMGEYITAIWGWDEQVQRAFHDRAFNPRITVAVSRSVTALQLSVAHDPSGAVTYRHLFSAGPVQAASAARRVL
jgi:hypothetical protein